MTDRGNARPVYSAAAGRLCPRCGWPERDCKCSERSAIESVPSKIVAKLLTVHCCRAAYRTTQYRAERPRRSWGKSALIVGASAGTGAGIGGIVAGRRGVLIGVALGGGVGTLYEGAKRR